MPFFWPDAPSCLAVPFGDLPGNQSYSRHVQSDDTDAYQGRQALLRFRRQASAAEGRGGMKRLRRYLACFAGKKDAH